MHAPRRALSLLALTLASCTQLRQSTAVDAGPDAVQCASGQRAVGTSCIADGVLPRPLSPLSLGDVSLLRPTLRWVLPQPFDGAEVQLCADRACATVLATLASSGTNFTSARPTDALPANRAVFWRVRGRVGATADASYGPTWLFHTPARDARAGVDTSYHAHLDVDGDGIDEALVGSPGRLSNTGAAYLYMGSRSGIVSDATSTFEGVASGDRYGSAVASAGDVNGDGYGDLLLGASGVNNNSGSVSLFLGAAAGLQRTAARVYPGFTPGDLEGAALAGVGDLNADGYGDIVLGAPGVNGNAGGLAVYHGTAGGPTDRAAVVIFGGGAFSAAVTCAGDVNGDGFSDMLVGAPNYTGTAGRVFLYLGSAVGVTISADASFSGAHAGDLYGTALAGDSDLDGDGYTDFAVGSPGVSGGAGSASVFLGAREGPSNSPAHTYAGAAPGGGFGRAMASAGDLNGDGFGDLVVGSPADGAGTASLYLGSAAGPVVSSSRALTGSSAGDAFGATLSLLGDVNGDGLADLAIGATNSNGGSGSVIVYLGASAGLGPRPLLTIFGGGLFGASLASAGPRPRYARSL